MKERKTRESNDKIAKTSIRLILTQICDTLIYVIRGEADRKMENRNVTLSIPRDIFKEAKLMAVQNDTSISGLMVVALTKYIRDWDGYNRAKERSLRLLKTGLNLGTGGKATWTRDELHER
jgi:hypothetical protein